MTEKLGQQNKDDKLGARAAELFPDIFKDAWKHCDAHGPGNRIGLYCSKCKIEYTRQNNELSKPCTVPDPLPITWDVAMKLLRTCDPDEVRDGLVRIWAGRESIPASIIKMWQAFSVWLITRATPADYIKVACEAIERKRESK